MVLDQRVGVNVDDPGIADGIVLGVLRADVVAVDDGVYAVTVDQQIGRADDLVRAPVLGVDGVMLDGAAQDAAQRVDLLDRQHQAALVLDSGRGVPAGQRGHEADGDRLAVRLGTVVDVAQHRAREGRRTGADGGALQHIAAANTAPTRLISTLAIRHVLYLPCCRPVLGTVHMIVRDYSAASAVDAS